MNTTEHDQPNEDDRLVIIETAALPPELEDRPVPRPAVAPHPALFASTTPTDPPKRKKTIMSELRSRFGKAEDVLASYSQYPEGIWREGPDIEGLPDGYDGTPPPEGWCREATTYYVEPELRPAYLAQLNDAAAEEERQVEVWQLLAAADYTVSVPTRPSPKLPESELRAFAHTTKKAFTVDPTNREHRQIVVHDLRLKLARAAVEHERTAPLRAAAQAQWTAERTCGACTAKSPNPLDTSLLLPGVRLCDDCVAVAQVEHADQLGARVVTVDGKQITRTHAVRRLLAEGSLS